MLTAEFVIREEISDLMYIKQGAVVIPGHTIVPKELWCTNIISVYEKNGFYRLVAYECGGGTKSRGRAWVYCNFAGAKLTPVEIYHGDNSNGRHAKFITVVTDHIIKIKPIIQIYAQREKDKVVCFVALCEFNGSWHNEIIISPDIDPNNIPDCFNHLSDAIKAAAEKASCYHCRHIHFADIGKEVLPYLIR